MSVIVRIYHSLTLLTYVFDLGCVLPISADFDIDCNDLIHLCKKQLDFAGN